MVKKLKLVTTGAGYFSQFQYEAWSRIKEVELVAICNRHVERARPIADTYGIAKIYTDIDEMLDTEKPDLIDIITPPVTHAPYCKAAIARAIPAICQKPFTSSLAEAEDLVAHMEAKSGTIIIHENFRFQPWYGKIRQILDSGRLGEIYEIQFCLRPGDGQGPGAYLDRQPYFQQMPRFLIHETGVHLIDVFRFLLGEVVSVYADLIQLNPAIKGEDAGIVLIEFANGARGIFNGNRLSDHRAQNRRRTMGELRIEGSKGVLRLNGDGEIFCRVHGSDNDEQVSYDWSDNAFGGDCVYRTQRHIIDHLVHGEPVMNSAPDYLANQRIVELVYQSDRAGRKFNVERAGR
ncbi:Oxidoreductase, N-terminal [hydrothermal vent metagenome]|uniref:Oxidoreductase, N-terminal n=1 Tax=hydrothermal vent metagenome TaxID=652676 RepID=A0A3B0SVC4_9ZZZZ